MNLSAKWGRRMSFSITLLAVLTIIIEDEEAEKNPIAFYGENVFVGQRAPIDPRAALPGVYL